jgi:hypothetical protein
MTTLRLPVRLPDDERGHIRRWDMASDLVGDTGFEPVTSSVSTRSSPIRDVRSWLYALLTALALIGVAWCADLLAARSSPRILPTCLASFARPLLNSWLRRLERHHHCEDQNCESHCGGSACGGWASRSDRRRPGLCRFGPAQPGSAGSAWPFGPAPDPRAGGPGRRRQIRGSGADALAAEGVAPAGESRGRVVGLSAVTGPRWRDLLDSPGVAACRWRRASWCPSELRTRRGRRAGSEAARRAVPRAGASGPPGPP